MKAYREYARGRGFGTTVRFSSENQHLFLITDKKSQCIIKYGTRLESGRTSFSLLYRLLFTYIINTYSTHAFVALSCRITHKELLLPSKCSQIDFLLSGATSRFLYGRAAALPLPLILVYKSHQTANSSLII